MDNNGTFETTGQNVAFSAATLDGPGSKTVGLQVCDNKGACTTTNASITINNVSPSIGTITASVNPIQINTNTTASATFTDPGVLDTHTAVWNWGDGTTSNGTMNETNGSGSIADSHSYTAPGVYTVNLTVTDKDNGQGTAVYQYISAYDPSTKLIRQ